MDKRRTSTRTSKAAKPVRGLPVRAKQARKIKGGFLGSLLKNVKDSKPTSGATFHDLSIVKNLD